MSKQRGEFVAVLARELPERSIPAVIDLAAKLMRWGRQYCRLQEAACNRELTLAEQQAENRLETRIAVLCQEHGLGAIMGGDPRGATVKIELPSGRTNSLSGEGWCVPGS